jgi:hypothetical protein
MASFDAEADYHTSEHTRSLRIGGLVYHGSFHGTTYRGIDDATLVHDSGWRYVEGDDAWWLSNDETGETRFEYGNDEASAA